MSLSIEANHFYYNVFWSALEPKSLKFSASISSTTIQHNNSALAPQQFSNQIMAFPLWLLVKYTPSIIHYIKLLPPTHSSKCSPSKLVPWKYMKAELCYLLCNAVLGKHPNLWVRLLWSALQNWVDNTGQIFKEKKHKAAFLSGFECPGWGRYWKSLNPEGGKNHRSLSP